MYIILWLISGFISAGFMRVVYLKNKYKLLDMAKDFPNPGEAYAFGYYVLVGICILGGYISLALALLNVIADLICCDSIGWEFPIDKI